MFRLRVLLSLLLIISVVNSFHSIINTENKYLGHSSYKLVNGNSYYVSNSKNIDKCNRKDIRLNMMDELNSVILVASESMSSLSSSAISIQAIVNEAATKAFNGGTAGASAAAIQVCSLMWLRTAVNYQYRYGTSTAEALKELYSQGGISRLYKGIQFAIVQGPLSRFGDTAANSLVFSLFEVLDPTGTIPLFIKSGLGSVTAGVWRIFLMPIDTAKTCLQVDGEEGFELLLERVNTNGLIILFNGALAASAATFVGHFPWFLTYNYLSSHLPLPVDTISFLNSYIRDSSLNIDNADTLIAIKTSIAKDILNIDPKIMQLLRSAFIGLCASSISDVSSNSLRVLKTARQTKVDQMNDINENSKNQGFALYKELVKEIVEKDGVKGLFGRGLQV